MIAIFIVDQKIRSFPSELQ